MISSRLAPRCANGDASTASARTRNTSPGTRPISATFTGALPTHDVPTLAATACDVAGASVPDATRVMCSDTYAMP